MSERSRPLLLLSGAPYLLGFKDDRSRWLSAFIEGCTRDPMNGRWEVSHSSLVMGLVEWFGAILGGHSRIIQRHDLARDRLAGLSDADRFAVLHTGPHYEKLASLILEKTDLKVVIMTRRPAEEIEVAARTCGLQSLSIIGQAGCHSMTSTPFFHSAQCLSVTTPARAISRLCAAQMWSTSF